MQSEQIDDLKQFIENRATQTESTLGSKIEQLELKFDGQISELRNEMSERFEQVNERFDGVAEAIETLSGHVDERLSELEKEIGRAHV